MSAKPKSKTGRLDDQQVQATVNLVKHYWPDYPISPADIQKPTREFVLNFYTNCVNNLDDKCTFVIRSNHIPYPPGLSEEELLYLKLSKIPTLVDADFKLGDLLTFDPKRVYNHIYVITHFMIFTDTVMDKMVQICNRVFDTKDNMIKDEEELKNLKEEKMQKEIKLTLAKAENKKLKEIAAQIAPKYEEVVTLKEDSDKQCKDLMLEIETLKSEVSLQQDELQKLPDIELEKRKLVVTENEVNNLKENLKSLKEEEKNLEEIDMGNGLLEEKQNIEQLQMCVSKLNQIQLSENLFKVSELKVQLKNQQQSLEYDLAVKQKLKAEIKHSKTQLEKQKQELEKENETLQKSSTKLKKNFVSEEIKIKKKYQDTVKANSRKIKELNKNLEQIEADCKRLNDGLLQGYISICKAPNVEIKRFEGFLGKIGNKMEKESS